MGEERIADLKLHSLKKRSKESKKAMTVSTETLVPPGIPERKGGT